MRDAVKDGATFVKIDQPRHVAIHEAGHAVIGRVLGMICGQVSVLADDDSSGHSITENPWVTLEAWERRGKFREAGTCFRGRILTFMAGAEAEAVLLGKSEGGDLDDRREIAAMFESEALKPGQNVDLVEERMRRATRSLCLRHRSKIERLATALEKEGYFKDESMIRSIAGLPEALEESEYIGASPW